MVVVGRTGTAILLFIFIAVLGLPGCGRPDSRGGKPQESKRTTPAVPVTAGKALLADVPVQLEAVGTLQASSSVAVKAQVSGQLAGVHFREGQDVGKGDPLFTIDPRPLEAALREAEGNLARSMAQRRQAEALVTQKRMEEKRAAAIVARDRAQLDLALIQGERTRELFQRNLIAKEQYEQAATEAAAQKATVDADSAAMENAAAAIQQALAGVEHAGAVIAADRAVVDRARLELEHTRIRAPMGGRTGRILVYPGNTVNARDTANPLVVLHQIRPIHMTFAVPERYLPAIARHQAAGFLRVEARMSPDERAPAAGKLTFLDNTVNPATGTIQLRAMFPNADNALWPGRFATAILTLATLRNVVVVPSHAVQMGQEGPYLFVVTPDRTAELRRIDVGETHEDATVVTRGVSAGEDVVTDGQLRLFPGARVEVQGAKDAPRKRERP